MLLEVNNLSVNYGEIKAVKDVSFNIKENEIITIIGSNGAGKTTILETIAGINKSSSGSIVMDGVDITQSDSSSIVGAGISLTPEDRRVFPQMSVYENLQIGSIKRGYESSEKMLEFIYEIFPVLKERRTQYAGLLSGGEQQMLAMARSLMSSPKLLMLDEPSLGLAPIYVSRIFKVFETIRNFGTTILIVEQNARKALSISDRAYIIETGKIRYEGSGEQLLNDDKVFSIYFGGKL